MQQSQLQNELERMRLEQEKDLKQQEMELQRLQMEDDRIREQRKLELQVREEARKESEAGLVKYYGDAIKHTLAKMTQDPSDLQP